MSNNPLPEASGDKVNISRRALLGGLAGTAVWVALPGSHAAAAAANAAAAEQTVIDLDGVWRFQTDPDRVGHTQAEHWFSDDFDDSGWGTIESGAPWESQGYDYAGYAWYRQQLTIPAESDGVPLVLVLGPIVSDDDVYVNGKRIGGVKGEYKYNNWMLRTYAVRPADLRYGTTNTLAIRMWGGNLGFEGRDSGLVEGTYQAVLDPFWLMAKPTGGSIAAELPVQMRDLGSAQRGEAFELVFRFDPAVLGANDAVMQYALDDFYGEPIASGEVSVTVEADGIARGVVGIDAPTSQAIYLAGRFKVGATVVDSVTGETLFDNSANPIEADHLNVGGFDVVLPELSETFEETPYGSLKLVDVIDCSTTLDAEEHPYMQSSYTENAQRFNTPGAKVDVSVNTILGKPARESEYGWFAYRVGRGRMTVGNTYLLRIEYPEDKARYCPIEVQVGQNYMDIGWRNGVGPDDVYDNWPLSNEWQHYDVVVPLSPETVDNGGTQAGFAEKGMWVYFMNKLRPDFYFSLYEAGPAIASIKLYEIDPEAHAPAITTPDNLPQRTFMVDWERQPLHEPEDLVKYAQLMGYSALSPLSLKWHFMNYGDPVTGYDSLNSDHARYWVTSEYGGFRIINGEPSPQNFEIFEKEFAAGEVALGPNGGTGGASAGTYTIVVVSEADGLVISDLVVNDEATAGSWSVEPDLQAGLDQYGDREYKLLHVPENLQGQQWIRTAADSKSLTVDPLVTFTINQPATVYVAMNTRLGPQPWMDDSWAASDRSGPAPGPAVPGKHSVHFRYLRATKGSGIDYVPRFEYGGSYNLSRDAQPIGSDGEPAVPNRLGLIGYYGANLLKQETFDDLKVFLDSLLAPYADNNPQLKGALWRIRSDRMRISYGRSDVELFGAETETPIPPDLTDAELAQWASTGEIGEQYAMWWHGKRATFHQQVADLLKTYRSDLRLFYFNWDPDKLSLILPDLNQGAFVQRIVEIGGPAAYAEDREARAQLTADDYIGVIREGDFSGPYGVNRPDYGLRPELYTDPDGVRALAPLNYLCYVDKPEYVNYFQTGAGLAASNVISYDEIASRYINSKFETNMVLPGGGPFSMAMELLSYFHGDATTLTYTAYLYGRGFADAHRRFAQAFRALPAVAGDVIAGTDGDVKARTYDTENGVYVGIAHKGYTAQQITVDVPGSWSPDAVVTDLVAGEVIPTNIVDGAIRITIDAGPMELNAFFIAGDNGGGNGDVTFKSAADLVDEYYESDQISRRQQRPLITHLSVAERLSGNGLQQRSLEALDRFAGVADGVDDETARAELLAVANALRDLVAVSA